MIDGVFLICLNLLALLFINFKSVQGDFILYLTSYVVIIVDYCKLCY